MKRFLVVVLWLLSTQLTALATEGFNRREILELVFHSTGDLFFEVSAHGVGCRAFAAVLDKDESDAYDGIIAVKNRRGGVGREIAVSVELLDFLNKPSAYVSLRVWPECDDFSLPDCYGTTRGSIRCFFMDALFYDKRYKRIVLRSDWSCRVYWGIPTICAVEDKLNALRIKNPNIAGPCEFPHVEFDCFDCHIIQGINSCSCMPPSAVARFESVQSPFCKLHLFVNAMAGEKKLECYSDYVISKAGIKEAEEFGDIPQQFLSAGVQGPLV
ncbi:MAG: hypothetical protein LBB34_02880 [Holosporales bacterium]|nr:hypothetical protein [Holosporales bacterium]